VTVLLNALTSGPWRLALAGLGLAALVWAAWWTVDLVAKGWAYDADVAAAAQRGRETERLACDGRAARADAAARAAATLATARIAAAEADRAAERRAADAALANRLEEITRAPSAICDPARADAALRGAGERARSRAAAR